MYMTLQFIASLTLVTVVYSQLSREDPEVHYFPHQLITSKGYPAEDHWVTTEDGYILNMQRIPNGKKSETQPRRGIPSPRPVVFLQHGFLGASTNWITNLANESLGFILADAGFDVWLGNVRGNTYSKNHTHLKPSSDKFWNFRGHDDYFVGERRYMEIEKTFFVMLASFDEHIKYDLPAMLNYALKVSGQDQLSYVGHSQGTAMGFGGFSSMPELSAKVKLFVALAPVANITYVKGAFRILVDYYQEERVLFDILGVRDLLPHSALIELLGSKACPVPGIKELCGNIMFLAAGFDEKNLNLSRIPVYVAHTPAGTSVKNAVHWAQLAHHKRFAMYDYGSKKKNEEHYGQPSPPDYNVSQMSVPTAAFSGGHDWLADPTDVANLLPKIPHLIYHLNIDYYEHLDFIWGLDSGYVIYPHVINQILQETE